MKRFIIALVVVTFALAVFGPLVRGFHHEGTQPVAPPRPAATFALGD